VSATDLGPRDPSVEHADAVSQGNAGRLFRAGDELAQGASDATQVTREGAVGTSVEDISHSPSFVVEPNGETVIVPKGATGPTPTRNGLGFQYKGGSGGNGLHSTARDVRIMEPVTGGKYDHPNGFASYTNGDQTINPFSGEPVGKDSGWWHMDFGQ